MAIYHERQTGSLCAIHACNNLLGAEVFTHEKFKTVKAELDIPDESGRCGPCVRRLPTCCCRHCRQEGEGNFDANVITMSLADKGVELMFWDERNEDASAVLAALKSEQCIGALINTQAGSHNCAVATVIRLLAVCFGKNGTSEGHRFFSLLPSPPEPCGALHLDLQ